VLLRLFDSTSRADRSIALLEFVNTACRIHKFLLAGEEGMAGGANAEFDVLPSGARFVSGTACTHDDGLLIVWMNFWLHF